MLERLVMHSRGWASDRAKARAQLAYQAQASLRDLLGDYDRFAEDTAPEGASMLLGTARSSTGRDVPIRLAFEDLACHTLISGATGCGKTWLITWIVANALRAGIPIGTLDCKSGFHEMSLAWAGAVAYGLPAGEREAFLRRLVVVNPFGGTLVPFNVCRLAPGATVETQSYDLARVLSAVLDSATLGIQMETALIHLLQLLMEHELSLAEAPLILQDEIVRGVLVARSARPAVKAYFARWEQIPSSSREALLTRLQALLLPENLRLMLGADELLDFRGIFDEGRPLFLFLGMGPGVPAELVELFGTLVLQFLFNGAIARGRRARPWILAGDEFFHLVRIPVLAQRFERGLDTFREFGFHLALVLHRLDQVPGSLRSALEQHADLKAIFKTSGREAMQFADALPETDPELVLEAWRRTHRPPGAHEVKAKLLQRLSSLPARHCYWSDRRKPYRAILLRVADVPEPHEAAGISSAELEDFIEAHGIRGGGAGISRVALRRQLEVRQERLRELVRPPITVASVPPIAAAENGTARNGRAHSRPRLG